MITSFVLLFPFALGTLIKADVYGTGNKTGLITNFPDKNHKYPLAIIMAPNDPVFKYLKILMIHAFQMALERIQSWNINPIIKNLQYYTDADSNCENTSLSLYYTVKLLTISKPNVWFGPACDYSLAPIARLVPFWNIPVVTLGGGASAFGKLKDIEYTTLTRVGTAIMTDHMNILFKAIFHKYKWTRVKFLYETTYQNFCRHVAQYFDYQKNITDRTFNSVTNLKMESLFEFDLGSENAVVVLCVEESTIRKILLKAYDLNFINGEYVFFNIDLFERSTKKPWHSTNDSDINNAKAKEAYRALLTITVHREDNEEYQNFLKEVYSRSMIEHTFYNLTPGSNSFLGAFHDSLLLYALALNDTLAMNKSFEDGYIITRKMWNRNFTGITGDVSIDNNGDRNADYSLLDMDKESGEFKVVANYIGKKQVYQPVVGQYIDWANKDNLPPPDIPVCGYNNKNCPKRDIGPGTITMITMGIIILVVICGGIYIYKRAKFQAELTAMNWLIPWNHIETKEKRHHLSHKVSDPIPNTELISKRFRYSKRNLSKNDSEESDVLIGSQTLMTEVAKLRPSRVNSIVVSLNSWESFTGMQLDNLHYIKPFITTAIYRGNVVALKKLHGTKKVEINRSLLIEVKKVKDLNNEHICRFIGICLDASQHWLLNEYCPKGSLQDILENEQINLDWMFKFSLIQDICRAMIYLHSNLGPHGNLKSSNCLVDSRFVLKICDFGLEKLRGNKDYLFENDEYAYYRHLLWTSPELLRCPNELNSTKTIKGDVYSFGIICQEVVYRNGVFYVPEDVLEPKQIVEKVKKVQLVPFRPFLSQNEGLCSEGLCKIIRLTWLEDFTLRPDFRTIKGMMRYLNKGGDSGNILDNLLSRMEQYANNLEELVNQRTEQYLEEKRKTEDLLYSMLPKSVAGQLIRNETVTAESYEMVSIYFSDIVGFTALSAESTPMQVIELLNRLYTTFDSIIESFDVYKVETIGDAYMVCSGLPQRNGNIHIREIARMSLAFLSAIFEFEIPHKPNRRVELRIGIHSGPVCAGVVGLKMPRYCLFGDTVNTASRMESNGLPLKIHMSEQSVEVLRTFQKFLISKRGLVSMKGKGYQTTYWLHGEDSKIVDPIPDSCECLK